MKTLIAYATETGVTGRCAEELAALLPECTLLNIADESDIAMRDFDTIILGSYVRMGFIDPGMQQLAGMGEELFLSKKLGLFVCGLDKEHAVQAIREGFGGKLADHASAAACFGGELVRKEELSFRDRMILKYAQEWGNGEIDHEAIARFAESI